MYPAAEAPSADDDGAADGGAADGSEAGADGEETAEEAPAEAPAEEAPPSEAAVVSALRGGTLEGVARVLEAAATAGAALTAAGQTKAAVARLAGALGREDVPSAAQAACADALTAMVRADGSLARCVIEAEVGAEAVPQEAAGVLALARESVAFDWVSYEPPPPPKKKKFGLLSAVVAKARPEAPEGAPKVRDGPAGAPECQAALLRLSGALVAVGGDAIDDAFDIIIERKAPMYVEVLEHVLAEAEIDKPEEEEEEEAGVEGEEGEGEEAAGSAGAEGENEGDAAEVEAEAAGDEAAAQGDKAGVDPMYHSDDEESDPPEPEPSRKVKVSAPVVVRLAALAAAAEAARTPAVRVQLEARAERFLAAAAGAAAAAQGAVGGPLVGEHLSVVVEAAGGGVDLLARLARDDRGAGAHQRLSGAARGALHAALLAQGEEAVLPPPRPPPRPPSPPPVPPPVRFSRSLSRMRRPHPRRAGAPASPVAAAAEAEPAQA